MDDESGVCCLLVNTYFLHGVSHSLADEIRQLSEILEWVEVCASAFVVGRVKGDLGGGFGA